MSSCESCGGGGSTLVLNAASIAVLGKVLQQQKLEGRAVIELLEGVAAARPKGAPELGKGSLVDVVA